MDLHPILKISSKDGCGQTQFIHQVIINLSNVGSKFNCHIAIITRFQDYFSSTKKIEKGKIDRRTFNKR